MSERERWIVYPLLFLALGAALRDKLIKRTTSDVVVADTVQCKELQVVNQNRTQTLAVLHGNTLKVGNVQANYMIQRGRPVLDFNPQLLDALRVWGGAPIATPVPRAPSEVPQPPES
ncbi:MAG: hypothetical protein KDA37_03185 [Planctomycetales bacterium]|nr:hypothetical protein [Planctomycetales bacterium]